MTRRLALRIVDVGVFFLVTVAIIFALATVALAGSVTIVVRNDANTILTTKVLTISNANQTRLLAQIRATYGQVPSGPSDPQTGVVPLRDMTVAEALDAWITGFWRGTLANIRNHEQSGAAKSASDAIVPVPE